MGPPRPVDASRVLAALRETPRIHPGHQRWMLLRAEDLAVLAFGDGPPRGALNASASPVSEAVVLVTGAGEELRAVVVDPDGPLPDATSGELGAVAYELAAEHEPVATIEVLTAGSVVALAAAVVAGDPIGELPFHDPALWVVLAWRVCNDRDPAERSVARQWQILANTVHARGSQGFAQDWVDAKELIDACARLGGSVVMERIGWSDLAEDPRAGAVLLASPEFRSAIGTLGVHAPVMLDVLTDRARSMAAAAGMLTQP